MNFLLLITLLVLSPLTALSQDILQKKDGDKIEAIVIEITDNTIKFRLYSHSDGPIRNISISAISSIIYENGTIEEFDLEVTNDPLFDFMRAIKEANLNREFIYANGVFFDGLTGFNITRRPNNSFYQEMSGYVGFRIGNKWYFGKSMKNRVGIQATWLRVGFYFTDGIEMADVSPLNIGLTNITSFTKNSGMEMNFNVGPVLSGSFDDPELHMSLGPEIKFRYHFMSFGLDYRYAHGPIVSSSFPYDNHTVSMSIGTKF